MQAGNQQQQKQSAEKKQTARIFDDSAYVCGRYKCTIVIDSPTHAIEINVGRYGTEVKREFSLVINGKNTVLKGYWHHQSGHKSSHFVYDKV